MDSYSIVFSEKNILKSFKSSLSIFCFAFIIAFSKIAFCKNSSYIKIKVLQKPHTLLK